MTTLQKSDILINICLRECYTFDDTTSKYFYFCRYIQEVLFFVCDRKLCCAERVSYTGIIPANILQSTLVRQFCHPPTSVQQFLKFEAIKFRHAMPNFSLIYIFK